MSEFQDISVVSEDNIETRITDETLYKELRKRSGGSFSGDNATIQSFDPIYRKLHTLATKFGQAYTEVARRFGTNPGRIDVVLVGGRTKGTPHKQDSDLDIIFCTEHRDQSIEAVQVTNNPDEFEEMAALKAQKMTRLKSRISDICQEEQVPNPFDIVLYGDKLKEAYNEPNKLLLAQVEP